MKAWTRSAVFVCLVAAPALRAQVAFPDGVASGDVTSMRAVLWTRTARSAAVTLEVSEKPDFQESLQVHTMTSEQTGLTAKVVLTVLKPDQTYYYRWRTDESTSETGKFRTAPLSWTPKSLRFTFSGDSDATNVNGQPAIYVFKVLAAAREEHPDFFIYLGDVVYTDSEHRGAAGRARTIGQFRETYQAGRQIPALRELLREVPIYAVWDDHEVANDWDAETVDPDLFATGRQAFVEYMPVSDAVLRQDATCIGRPFFRYIRWGSDADFIILDERTCRNAGAAKACVDAAGRVDSAPTLPGISRALLGMPVQPPPGCLEALNDPSRTMIGETQKWLLKTYLLYSNARFKFVVNEVPIQQFFILPYDRWEGYAAERKEILSFIRENRIRNVIFLTADAHANMMNEVSVDMFSNPEPVADEFVVGPIGTTTLAQGLAEAAGVSAEFLNQAMGLIGMDCWDLDTFGYGLVKVDAKTGTATVTIKDENGQVIHSQGDRETPCTKTFGP